MRNSFNDFIVNESNRAAYELAIKAAKGKVDFLVIYGPDGCGKSHLLDGIWNYSVNYGPKKPEWLSSIGLSDAMLAYNYDVEKIVNSICEDISLWLVDDIDCVDDKHNGEVLSKVIEGLINKNIQISLTSTQSIDKLSDSLKRVLEKATCVEVRKQCKK